MNEGSRGTQAGLRRDRPAGCCWVRVLILGAVLASGVPAATASTDPAGLFDPATGMRRAALRAPVPGPPEGVREVTPAEALQLHADGEAWFIDVMPVEGGVLDPASGIRQPVAPRPTIPGALWHPGVGRADAREPEIAAFLARMQALARARPGQPFLVFCVADCWMSWNAALRLRRAGLGPVLWFGEGTDGWVAAGRRLAPVWPDLAGAAPAAEADQAPQALRPNSAAPASRPLVRPRGVHLRSRRSHGQRGVRHQPSELNLH